MPMNNRLAKLFSRRRSTDGGDPFLSVFFTVGYPEGMEPIALVAELERRGVACLELGFPFSDPIADGPVIQESSKQALAAGMTMKRYFQALMALREQVSVPVFFMGYFNSVLQCGVERFCAQLQQIGIDGVIIPDLPVEEYLDRYEALFRRYEIAVSFLITPRTSRARVKLLASATTGFLYAVCQPAITGGTTELSRDTTDWLTSLEVEAPIVSGFGFRKQTQLSELPPTVCGAIVGSEFIRKLSPHGDISASCSEFFASFYGSR